MTPDSFYQQLGDHGKGDKVPPVEKWNPPLSGEMDLIIKSDGQWLHEGTPIKRQGLKRTFSRVLKHENNEYFLVTPVEKWRIQVERAPFFVRSVEVTDPGDAQTIIMNTSTDNSITVNADHPLWVEYDSELNPTPYVLVRENLHGLIGRNVYNELADIADRLTTDSKTIWQIHSCGSTFLLGEIPNSALADS